MRENSFRSTNEYMSDPLELNIERPRVLYRQIGEQIRNLIINGDLAPGTKLPSSTELAAKWQTHPATIHAALAPLAKEGLLTRQPKIGTFVSQRSSRLLDVGIYYDSNIWQNQANAFKRAVHVELARLLESRHINVHVWFDPRSEKRRGETWAKLRTAAERREIQAIIATDVPGEVVGWLQSLPVFCSYFTRSEVPNRVQLDFNQFTEASIALLKKQGCRSIGFISSIEPEKIKTTGDRDFYHRFSALCRAQNMIVRPEWIRMAHGFVRDESQEEFGYKEFKKIWRQSQRPEGLVVFPDTSVTGVVMSIFEQGVEVPRNLKIVAHKHKEINFLCPLTISHLYSSTAQIAAALFTQIERQFNGVSCTPIILPFCNNLSAFRSSSSQIRTPK